MRAATGVDSEYRAACLAVSRSTFICCISSAARHARRSTDLLLDLVQQRHATIESARELMLESRALASIFQASAITARSRRETDGRNCDARS
jgi:hypothetical protein